MFWRRRDGAEVSERVAALEVRLASLAAEVQSALGKVEVWGAREVARQAAFEEATDKLYRTAERARKLRSVPRSEDDDDGFWDTFDARRRGVASSTGDTD